MINYCFDYDLFDETFKIKDKNSNMNLKHHTRNMFKLFPYLTSGKKISPIDLYPEEIVCEFVKTILNIECKLPNFDEITNSIDVEIEEEYEGYFKNIISNIFFNDGNFKANNIALYKFHSFSSQKDVPYREVISSSEISLIKDLCEFLVSVFDVDEEVKICLKKAMENYEPNVLESLMIDVLGKYVNNTDGKRENYFVIHSETAKKFKEDLLFMLENGMTDYSNFINLISIYYLNYVAQTCFILNRFCNVDRSESMKLYFGLDWEKISLNRDCCKNGWKLIKPLIENMFSHAVTLEILNQITDSTVKYDYIKLGQLAKSDKTLDIQLANEINKATLYYVSKIKDCPQLSEVEKIQYGTQTETEIQYLFSCIKEQFVNTSRHRAQEKYAEKFELFCKTRWLKNRRKAGLVLNLTEQDIIFLTKISIKNQSKIRLNLLFVEFEKRGISLDNTSKEMLTQYFSQLNLIDKKSDSGDAQYVKQIL